MCERLLSRKSLWVSVRFCAFCAFGHVGRAGMSYRVNVYSLSGGGSIGTLPGVVPAAWGGPWRARRAVRAAPKTRNCGSSRVLRAGIKENALLRSGTHAHFATVHGMLCGPFPLFLPSRALCASPLAGGSAGAARAPWLGGAAHAAFALPSASSARRACGRGGRCVRPCSRRPPPQRRLLPANRTRS